MIIYNTTFHINKDVFDQSLEYFKQIYIPKAIQSGLLSNPVLRRILHEDEEGISLCVQFHVKDQEVLHLWIQQEGATLQQELVAKFNDKVAGFSTLLDEIEL